MPFLYVYLYDLLFVSYRVLSYKHGKENSMIKKIKCMTHNEFKLMLSDMQERYQVVGYRYSYEHAYAEFTYYEREEDKFEIPPVIHNEAQQQSKVRLNLGMH